MVAKDDTREAREAGPLSKELRASLGNNFREARTRKGLSQQQIAAATGITQGRIARIELGQVNVTLETIMRIARVVDSDPLHLLRPPSPENSPGLTDMVQTADSM
jgi:transcriptional regulator with XRE-family HTH domain